MLAFIETLEHPGMAGAGPDDLANGATTAAFERVNRCGESCGARRRQ